MAKISLIKDIDQYSYNFTVKTSISQKSPLKISKNGNPYFYFKLKDTSGTVEGTGFNAEHHGQIMVSYLKIVRITKTKVRTILLIT